MSKIYTSDIAVLFQLLVNETKDIIIYDTDNQIIEDHQNTYQVVHQLDDLQKKLTKNSNVIFISKINNIIDFSFKNGIDFENNNFKNKANLTQFSYQFFNNPNGTIRWIYPKTLKYPSFLTLYNASGWKSELIRWAFQLAFRFGFKSKLNSGAFRLISSSENAVETFVNEAKGECYSIFTGTVGDNRKAIIEVNRHQKTTNFIKVPLGEKSEKLIEREKTQLQQFAHFNFQKAVIPQIIPSRNPKIVILSNVQPSEKFATLNDLTNVHLTVLEEWYDATNETKTLAELPEYQLIKENIKRLSTYPKPANDLPENTVKTLIDGLKNWFETLDSSQQIAVGIAHYDFTPWNMYCTQSRLHIYDWELSRNDLPILYDAFHFIFQSSILVKRSTAKELQTQIVLLKNSAFVQKLNQNPHFDFDTNYRFYLLSVASYYLDLYIRQTPLHTQAHWLVEMWQFLVRSRQ